jgi:mono/diheme cytochrome c family protein
MTKAGGCAARLGLALLLPASATWAGDNGKQLYETNCAICHMADGAGSPGVAPPLRNPVWKRLGSRAADYVAGVMVSGLVGVPLDGAKYFAAMPPWLQLTDAQLAAIGSYVLHELNGEKTGVTAAAVKQARDSSPSHAALKMMRDGGG